jgi:hypothetical protein
MSRPFFNAAPTSNATIVASTNGSRQPSLSFRELIDESACLCVTASYQERRLNAALLRLIKNALLASRRAWRFQRYPYRASTFHAKA